MAASTTCPWPETDRSTSAASTPTTSNIPPPPKSATRFRGGVGRLTGPADVGQHAGDGQVGQVVAGALRQRTLLTPSGHPSVHQAGMVGPQHVGPQAEPLRHTGPEALEQHVGPARQAAGQRRAVR